MKRIKPFITLIMFTSLFNLFGCSGETDGSLNQKTNSSIDDFNNTPINKILTEQIIDATSDSNLVYLIFENLSQKIPKDYRLEYQTVVSWTTSKQAIYVIWLLEGEVNNGGFNQFYSNSSGQFYKLLPGALKLVGANKFANLSSRANNTYEKENDIITKHQDGTIEGFSKSYENNPLNKFDDEFYELYKIEDLQKLQVDFIRKHKIEFTKN